MLALFCLRLALGLMACLLIVPARLVHPRFYRTHFLIVLGLVTVAAAFLPSWNWLLAVCIGVAIVQAFVASIAWRIEGAPGGYVLIVLSIMFILLSFPSLEFSIPGGPGIPFFVYAPEGSGWFWHPGRPLTRSVLGDMIGAMVIGASVTAMLMGHSYLISPGLSLQPLRRLLIVLAAAVVIRAAADGYAIWIWGITHLYAPIPNDAILFLSVRWLVGIILLLVLVWMAWKSALTSTQSATGIMYVAVVFCFIGELTALLLRERGLAM